MNTQHTPGPWIEKELPHGAIYIEAHPDLNNGHNIAKCFGPDREANARLIAAAPELLEACETALANLAPAYSSDHLVMKRLRAAIAKATQP